MKIFYTVILALATGSSLLSAIPAASPRDPAFLDNFSDQQKEAIHRYLTLDQRVVDELAASSDAANSAPLNAENLKNAYVDYLNDWGDKFGTSIIENKQESSLLANRQTNAVDFNSLSENITQKCGRKGRCANAIPITAEDIGCKGYIIKKPGHYRLCIPGGIFHWKPVRLVDLITIDADNVVLDLRHTTVIQRPNSEFVSSAINILSERQNITILNGNLVGFTADSIKANVVNQLVLKNISIQDNNNRQVYLPTTNFGSINLQTCSNVLLQNIRIANTTLDIGNEFGSGSGILLFNVQNFLIEDCSVSNSRIFANPISQFIGIASLVCHNGIIRNCNVAGCTSSAIMPGFGYVLSQNILTENCTSNYNIGRQTTSGFYPQFSNYLQFVNCEASNNRSICQDCHGFPYFISINGYFSNCRALNNVAENPTGQGFTEKATGFEILVSSNCLLDNCLASNNRAVNPIRHYAAGFANGTSIDVIFRNCVSLANTAVGNSSRGVGFGPALDPRFYLPSVGTIWENCIAEGNSGDALSIGFDLFGQVCAILTGSKSQLHISGQGVGILSNGPYDQGNPVDVPCDVVPIVVLTDNAANNILVKDNIVTNNSLGGIVDLTGANNVYIDNTVFNNGFNFLGPIFAFGTPIRDWTLQSAPSNANNNGVVGDKLDNLNITTP